MCRRHLHCHITIPHLHRDEVVEFNDPAPVVFSKPLRRPEEVPEPVANIHVKAASDLFDGLLAECGRRAGCEWCRKAADHLLEELRLADGAEDRRGLGAR